VQIFIYCKCLVGIIKINIYQNSEYFSFNAWCELWLVRPRSKVAPGRRGHPIDDFYIVLPHLSRAISIDDSFAESFSTPNSPIWICASMRTKSSFGSPGTHPSNQAEMDAQSSDLSAIPSSSCCDISLSLVLPALPHALFSFSSSTPIISREYV